MARHDAWTRILNNGVYTPTHQVLHMIRHLDNLLRHLFMMQIDGLIDETQVRFQPPDEERRTASVTKGEDNRESQT